MYIHYYFYFIFNIFVVVFIKFLDTNYFKSMYLLLPHVVQIKRWWGCNLKSKFLV